MSVEYGDITSEEAIAFCLPDADKAREDTLTLLQVSQGAFHSSSTAAQSLSLSSYSRGYLVLARVRLLLRALLL